METHLWVEIITCLAVTLIVLGLWQRKIRRAESSRALAQIRKAESRGTRKALFLHPQMDPYRCMGCGSCMVACPEEGALGLVHGTAHMIHGSRCIGHGRCAEACPTGAISVGLGDTSCRPDIPILTDSLETSVPGVYIAGELGGIALIRHAIEQGSRAVEDIARRVSGSDRGVDSGMADVLIVGAGPAGLSAALRAKEVGLSARVIDQEGFGGTVRKYPRRKLTMVQPVRLPLHGFLKRREYLKEDLLDLWESIVREHRLDIRPQARLTAIDGKAGGFTARTSAGAFRARFVVLAMGRRGCPRKLGIPGEDAEKVLYQLIDTTSYTDCHVLVVGGGDSAVEAATALANQPGNTVTLSYRKPSFFRLKERNEARIQEYARTDRVRTLFASEPKEVLPDSVILECAVADGPGGIPSARRRELIRNDYVFVFAGGDPPYPLLKSMGIRFGLDPAKVEDARLPGGCVEAAR